MEQFNHKTQICSWIVLWCSLQLQVVNTFNELFARFLMFLQSWLCRRMTCFSSSPEKKTAKVASLPQRSRGLIYSFCVFGWIACRVNLSISTFQTSEALFCQWLFSGAPVVPGSGICKTSHNNQAHTGSKHCRQDISSQKFQKYNDSVCCSRI